LISQVRFTFVVRLSLLIGPLSLWGTSGFAQWESDMRLTYNDSTSFTSLSNAWCVAGSGDTVHTVWYDSRDGNQEIYYKHSTDGGINWGSDFRLTNDSLWQGYPSVMVSGPHVHVVWYDLFAEIHYKRSTDGGNNWSSDTRISSNIANAYCPSIAVTGSQAHVTWQDIRDGNSEIYYNRSIDSGATWELDRRLTYDTTNSYLPSVAVSGSNVHIVWYDNRDGNYEIYYKRSTDGGVSWEQDIRLTRDTARSYIPSVAVSGVNVHIVWRDTRDGNYEIYYKRSTDGGTTWGSDYRLTNDTAFSDHPSVAVSNSNVHLVWDDARNGTHRIFYKTSTDGGASWGPDTCLTLPSIESDYPSVAVSGSKVHVVWYDYRDGNSEIYYKRNPTGNVGVEAPVIQSGIISDRPMAVTPNPFYSIAVIKGHESETFVLYDISGRQVGKYKGGMIGSDLTQGVYFISELGIKCPKPFRIVKVR